VRSIAAVSAFATKALGPWLDVVIRLWLAQAFLTLAIVTMMTDSGAACRANAGWSGLLHNLTTSGFGVAVQTLCAVLLLGLFSRLAVAPARATLMPKSEMQALKATAQFHIAAVRLLQTLQA
jgi:hypothetical protein